MWRMVINANDSAVKPLPEVKQIKVPLVSTFYRRDGGDSELRMEFIYMGGDKWIPTWELAEETLKKFVRENGGEDVDVTFVVKVFEGSIMKRIVKKNGTAKTNIFLVTRDRLIKLLYDYERGFYVLNTGIKIKDLDKKRKSAVPKK